MGRRRPNVEEELLAREAEAMAEALMPPDQAKSQSPRRLRAPAAEASEPVLCPWKDSAVTKNLQEGGRG